MRHLEGIGDSGNDYGMSALELLAAQCGKSTESVRKIVDAATWVRGFYPEIFLRVPRNFAMTQALQLRAIHRLSHQKADEISQDVFEGRLNRKQLSDLLKSCRQAVRPTPKSKKMSSHVFEELLVENMSRLLKENGYDGKSTISSGDNTVPACDLIVSIKGEPAIAAEYVLLQTKSNQEKLLTLTGWCALWQNQGMTPWLVFPEEKRSAADKFVELSARCKIGPTKIFLASKTAISTLGNTDD